jgi:hypothetical protein
MANADRRYQYRGAQQVLACQSGLRAVQAGAGAFIDSVDVLDVKSDMKEGR